MTYLDLKKLRNYNQLWLGTERYKIKKENYVKRVETNQNLYIAQSEIGVGDLIYPLSSLETNSPTVKTKLHTSS